MHTLSSYKELIMSEATKILMERALRIETHALELYKKKIHDAVNIRDVELDDVTNLRKAAKLVCDHPEETEQTRTQACGTHGRELEEVTVYSCKLCGTYLRTI